MRLIIQSTTGIFHPGEYDDTHRLAMALTAEEVAIVHSALSIAAQAGGHPSFTARDMADRLQAISRRVYPYGEL